MTRVLAVDDDADLLKLISAMAQKLGCVVHTLDCPLHFMKTFVQFKPDVVILDLIMPQIDGIELIQWLCDVGYAGRLVVTSGFGDYGRMAGSIAEARGSMEVCTLSKPFRLPQLQAALSPAEPSRI